MANENGAATAAKKSKKQPALSIRSVSREGFRRCGLQFGPDARIIELSALKKEQIDGLKGERQLVVQETEIDSAEQAE